MWIVSHVDNCTKPCFILMWIVPCEIVIIAFNAKKELDKRDFYMRHVVVTYNKKLIGFSRKKNLKTEKNNKEPKHFIMTVNDLYFMISWTNWLQQLIKENRIKLGLTIAMKNKKNKKLQELANMINQLEDIVNLGIFIEKLYKQLRCHFIVFLYKIV